MGQVPQPGGACGAGPAAGAPTAGSVWGLQDSRLCAKTCLASALVQCPKGGLLASQHTLPLPAPSHQPPLLLPQAQFHRNSRWTPWQAEAEQAALTREYQQVQWVK